MTLLPTDADDVALQDIITGLTEVLERDQDREQAPKAK